MLPKSEVYDHVLQEQLLLTAQSVVNQAARPNNSSSSSSSIPISNNTMQAQVQKAQLELTETAALRSATRVLSLRASL